MDDRNCKVCGEEHISVVERVVRLEALQDAAREALVKADMADQIQFKHLNDVRREQSEARSEFVTKELMERELAIVKEFIHRQIAVWTLIAGAFVGAMLLLLKMVGH